MLYIDTLGWPFVRSNEEEKKSKTRPINDQKKAIEKLGRSGGGGIPDLSQECQEEDLVGEAHAGLYVIYIGVVRGGRFWHQHCHTCIGEANPDVNTIAHDPSISTFSLILRNRSW